MQGITAAPQPTTVKAVIDMLRTLTPRERLNVIAAILPEVDRDLPSEMSAQQADEPESLYGLWKHLNFDVTKADLAEVRKELKRRI